MQEAYNNFGQLTTQYQEHSGSVNTGSSLKVQYAYTTAAGTSRLGAFNGTGAHLTGQRRISIPARCKRLRFQPFAYSLFYEEGLPQIAQMLADKYKAIFGRFHEDTRHYSLSFGSSSSRFICEHLRHLR